MMKSDPIDLSHKKSSTVPTSATTRSQPPCGRVRYVHGCRRLHDGSYFTIHQLQGRRPSEAQSSGLRRKELCIPQMASYCWEPIVPSLNSNVIITALNNQIQLELKGGGIWSSKVRSDHPLRQNNPLWSELGV